MGTTLSPSRASAPEPAAAAPATMRPGPNAAPPATGRGLPSNREVPIVAAARERAARAPQSKRAAQSAYALALGNWGRLGCPSGAGAITAALPRRPEPARHRRALPHREVAAALAAVRAAGAWTKLAFEFPMLTATRSSDVRVGDVLQVDLVAREHRVLLSRYAVDILRESEQLRPVPAAHEPVFTSVRGKQIDGSSISKLVSELGVAAVSGVACTGARARPVESGRSPFGLGDSRARELADPHRELLNECTRAWTASSPSPARCSLPQALPPPPPAPRAVSRRGAGAILFQDPADRPESPVHPSDHAGKIVVPALGRSRCPVELGEPALQFGQHLPLHLRRTFRCPTRTVTARPRGNALAHKKRTPPPRGLLGGEGQGRVANAAAERYRRRYRRYPPTAKRPPSRNCATIGRAGTAASQR